jgi:hypothetical protein
MGYIRNLHAKDGESKALSLLVILLYISQSMIPLLSQLNPVYILSLYFFKIDFNIIIRPTLLVLPICLFPSGSLTESLHAILISPCALQSRPPQSPRFDNSNNICEQIKLWPSSACNFLNSVISSLLHNNWFWCMVLSIVAWWWIGLVDCWSEFGFWWEFLLLLLRSNRELIEGVF